MILSQKTIQEIKRIADYEAVPAIDLHKTEECGREKDIITLAEYFPQDICDKCHVSNDRNIL